MSTRNKLIVGFVAFATVLSLSGGAELASAALTSSQIQAILNLLTSFGADQATINNVSNALQGLPTTPGTGTAACTFSNSLTIGSTGTAVTCLQNFLIMKGFSIPAGATGYFGTQTRAAVAGWQAANNISPAVGFFGPISIGVYNSMPGTPPPPGPTPPPPPPSGTPGVEGTIVASKNPTPASGTKTFEGGARVGVLGIKLEAKSSDIRVERVKVKLDADTSGNTDQQFYTKIANMIYAMDGSTILASMPLDSNTVVKEGTDYYVTIAGFNFLVQKDTTKVLTIAIDPAASWDSTFDNDSWMLSVPVDGVRGIDGAGINQYSPSTSFNNTFISAADLLDSATLAVSLNSSSPETTQVICEQGTNSDECDGLEVARFDFKAEKDSVTVTDFVLDIVRGGTTTTASSSTAYLYDGSSLVGSASVVGTSATAMTATFTDIDWTIPADTTRTLSIKFDIRTAGTAATTFVASTDAADVTAENSIGTSVTPTGSADGKTITIRKVGPEITLLSKSITTDGVPQSSGSTTLSTSTLTATFNVRITARGGDLFLGTVASGTPLFAKDSAERSFMLYSSGVVSSVNVATSSSFTIPTTCVTSNTNSCTLAEGSSVDVSVTYLIPGRTAAGAVIASGLYSVGLESINWAPTSTGATTTTSFMTGLTTWRTSDVSFP